MHINKLSQKELCSELKYRDIALGTVEEMRHNLTLVLYFKKNWDIQKILDEIESLADTMSPVTEEDSTDKADLLYKTLYHL